MKTKVLIEMRPAFEGYAGIPQETRLLFSTLTKLDGYEVEGLLQGGHAGQNLSRGTKNPKQQLFPSRKIRPSRRLGTYSKVIISLKEKPYRSSLEKVLDWWRSRSESIALKCSIIANSKIKLSEFKTHSFEDFIWRTLFAKTLPSSEFSTIAKKNYKVLSISWHGMHEAGLSSLNWWYKAIYPKLDLGDVEIFIGQTPYPGRVTSKTKLIIRYHDAIPVFYPHTINDVSIHQAEHLYALEGNVYSGAWFACVSEATRQDLLKLHPELADRAVTIHNTVSPHYFREETPFERVRGIIRSRIYGFDSDGKGLGLTPEFLNLREQETFFKRNLFDKEFKYLLVVSTIEPRKNHTRAIAAWEILKEEVDPDLKLVIVGTLGWGYKDLVKGLRTWIDRGELFMLNAVPAPDLRVLYRHAAATVCPSVQEGFDFSGVEAMRSGGIALASDIPVHREIYEDAAEYFDPYSTGSTVDCLKRVLYSPDAEAIRARLEKRGDEISSRYLPDKIQPQWEAFLEKVKKSKN
ncbi:MAG: glycosyltransferase family 1 protein [Chthoniobacterales bacterium]